MHVAEIPPKQLRRKTNNGSIVFAHGDLGRQRGVIIHDEHAMASGIHLVCGLALTRAGAAKNTYPPL